MNSDNDKWTLIMMDHLFRIACVRNVSLNPRFEVHLRSVFISGSEYQPWSLLMLTLLREVMMRCISSTKWSWGYMGNSPTKMVGIQSPSIPKQNLVSVQNLVSHEWHSPTLFQLTSWRICAICSLSLVPFSHSLATQAGTCRSVRFFFCMIILRIRAFAALRSNS